MVVWGLELWILGGIPCCRRPRGPVCPFFGGLEPQVLVVWGLELWVLGGIPCCRRPRGLVCPFFGGLEPQVLVVLGLGAVGFRWYSLLSKATWTCLSFFWGLGASSLGGLGLGAVGFRWYSLLVFLQNPRQRGTPQVLDLVSICEGFQQGCLMLTHTLVPNIAGSLYPTLDQRWNQGSWKIIFPTGRLYVVKGYQAPT